MRLTADLFLITWPGDYPWLTYLFRSINKYMTGFDRLVMVLEEGDDPPREALDFCSSFPWVIRRCPRYRGTEYEGRSGQALEKLRAWSYTGADRIVFVDSDCVFCRPVDLQTDQDVNLARPSVWSIPWEQLPPYHYTMPNGDTGIDYATKWRDPVRNVLGFDPPAEAMQRFPFVFPQWFLRCLWEHIGGEERMRTFKDPCDFNVMGNFAMAKFPEFFTMREALNSPAPLTMKNFWSFSGVNCEKVQAELGRLGLLEDERPTQVACTWTP
jgi:hypothetical protein